MGHTCISSCLNYTQDLFWHPSFFVYRRECMPQLYEGCTAVQGGTCREHGSLMEKIEDHRYKSFQKSVYNA